MIPLDRCGLHVVGVDPKPLEALIAEAVEAVLRIADGDPHP